MVFAKALQGGGLAGLQCFEEFFGLRLELLETRPRWE
jgi:hypothetical protein